jgi:hypothetical protein
MQGTSVDYLWRLEVQGGPQPQEEEEGSRRRPHEPADSAAAAGLQGGGPTAPSAAHQQGWGAGGCGYGLALAEALGLPRRLLDHSRQ